MSEVDKRTQNGSAADRKPSQLQRTGSGGVLGLVIGLADWGIRCRSAGHYLIPDNALIEIGGSIVGVPFALWLGDVFSTIGAIITDWLNRIRKKGEKE